MTTKTKPGRQPTGTAVRAGDMWQPQVTLADLSLIHI